MESDGDQVRVKANGKWQKINTSPLDFLKEKINSQKIRKDPDLPDFQGGWFGFFSYEFARHFEIIPVNEPDLRIPEACFYLVEEFIVLDPDENSLTIVIVSPHHGDYANHYEKVGQKIAMLHQRISGFNDAGTPAKNKRTSPDFESNYQPENYAEKIRRLKDYIKAGDIFQANLSQRLKTRSPDTPLDVYQRLKEINPSPYDGLFCHPDFALVSSSPERLVRLADGQVDTRPIAGTRPRGENRLDDERLGRELILNEKERAEHVMLVDLERNDLGRVCQYGSVRVNELMVLEKYSHVIHIVSNVRGQLRSDLDAFDLLEAVFPGGTITGTPKIRCMEILAELENVARGPYTGSLGYISYTGDLDLNIIIRTIVMQNGYAYLQVGGGIVADSEPASEFRETFYKAQAMLEALFR